MKGMGMMPENRRKPMAEINVVPYIDVMLVLLIIFMVTAPMLIQGVKVDLPETSSDPIQADKTWNPSSCLSIPTAPITLRLVIRAATLCLLRRFVSR